MCFMYVFITVDFFIVWFSLVRRRYHHIPMFVTHKFFTLFSRTKEQGKSYIFVLNLSNSRSAIVNFGLLSLNAQGIRTFEKRKALFYRLSKNKVDIHVVFLQETYSKIYGKPSGKENFTLLMALSIVEVF